MNNTQKTIVFIGVTFFCLFVGAKMYEGGIFDNLLKTREEKAAEFMDQVRNEVAADAVDQYNIAAKSGDEVQMYVQAGIVAAAYLQAKDEDNYLKWKVIADQHQSNMQP